MVSGRWSIPWHTRSIQGQFGEALFFMIFIFPWIFIKILKFIKVHQKSSKIIEIHWKSSNFNANQLKSLKTLKNVKNHENPMEYLKNTQIFLEILGVLQTVVNNAQNSKKSFFMILGPPEIEKIDPRPRSPPMPFQRLAGGSKMDHWNLESVATKSDVTPRLGGAERRIFLWTFTKLLFMMLQSMLASRNEQKHYFLCDVQGQGYLAHWSAIGIPCPL